MSESKPAGMWRPIELTDGDIVKLFQSGEHGEANYRQFDGRWYVLDESPEGIAEARQEELIRGLDFFHRQNGDEISRLTADLAAEIAKLKEKLDHYINENEYLTSLSGHAQDECDRLKEELSKVIEKLDEECFLHGHKLADQVNLCRELGLEMDSDLSDIRHEVFNMRNEIAKLRKQRGRLLEVSKIAAKVFREYEKIHSDKMTGDGALKAIVNAEHAQHLETVVAAIESETSPDAWRAGLCPLCSGMGHYEVKDEVKGNFLMECPSCHGTGKRTEGK